MRRILRQTALLWLLTLVTAAWGGVVAGHEHFGIDHEHCHICLLPQVADVASGVPAALLPPPPSPTLSAPVYHYSAPACVVYQSRAPPV